MHTATQCVCLQHAIDGSPDPTILSRKHGDQVEKEATTHHLTKLTFLVENTHHGRSLSLPVVYPAGRENPAGKLFLDPLLPQKKLAAK